MTRRKPTDEELYLWRQVSARVKPLKGRSARPPAEAADGAQMPAQKPAKAAEKKAAKPSANVAPALPPAQTPPPPLVHGGVIGVDHRQAERFRKGKLDIDARLDLHGRTQSQAHDDLLGFLRRSKDKGARCVLVITGKGMTAGKGGVLRQTVPRWLNEPAFRSLVLAFDYARMKDGGEGALYVLLKRTK